MRKVLVILAAAAVFSLLAATTAFAQAERPNITVSGAGAVTAEPDIATMTFGVSTDDRNPREAIIRNNRDIAAVLAAVRAHGISDDDIATSNFNLSQRMNWNTGTSEGYTVNNAVSVTVRDLDTIGDLMGVAIAAGANVTSNVRFAVEDSEALYREALALAAADARAKADALARAMNVNITTILSVRETSAWMAPLARSAGAIVMADSLQAHSDMGFGVPIETGEISITARVDVVFAIN